MNKENNIATLPKKGLKTIPYNIGMDKKSLKTRHYSKDMEKKDLKKLTKGQLIKLLLKQEAKKPISPPRTEKWKSVNEDIIIPPPEQFRDGYKPRTDRPFKMQNAQRTPKLTRKSPQPPKPKDDFNFDDDIFQTENTSLGKFKIISIQSRENKKFKSYTNEFKVKILKNWTMLKRSITYSKSWLKL